MQLNYHGVLQYLFIRYFWLKNDSTIHILFKIGKGFSHHCSCQDVCTNHHLFRCIGIYVVTSINGEEGGLIVTSKNQT